MAPLPSISIASITIGFISFAFTLAIWLHAFWDAFLTLGAAPHQIQDALSTLRQGLYEEREYLRRVRRVRESRHSPNLKTPQINASHKALYYEGGPTRVMTDAVKDLIAEFKDLERPFLVSPHTGTEKELEWSYDATQQYYRCDLVHRLIWLRRKGGVESIGVRLNKIQTRRIAVEVTEAHFMLSDAMGLIREMGGKVQKAEDRIARIQDRLMISQVGWDEIEGRER
ncbi:hypothetical protein GLAREA_08021 [Glarea lozoyensis ATCC 20868]|uniref:Uncharacterized protein n=1 Tax=Glarea lozoyensis (strain ATCC 20868 / MF5171) TaxID=1116229 RepID=S3CWH1_GLAL2|nr:uncharacterized protein GLAREA_08021 [Glarea lozoyensis ATCC 20868]EPE24171.1 hypothetical protein GLAREA_08021 [Glarea lozoyensis ATCC 20868]